MKRPRDEAAPAQTPSKRNRHQQPDNFEDELLHDSQVVTPSKAKRRGKTPSTSTPQKIVANGTAKEIDSSLVTPGIQRSVVFATPSKSAASEDRPATLEQADRSARRKSSRKLIERALDDENSEDSALDEDEALAETILEDNASQLDEDENVSLANEALPEPEVPVKRGRGRPKGSKRKKSPTPPLNLPPQDRYFWQNKPGSNKTSDNKLPSKALLNHDEYFQQMQKYEETHSEERDFLLTLHARSFEQWQFELENDFSICLYGYGSKRHLVNNFAQHVFDTSETPPKIVVVNAYVADITIRDILTSVAEVLLPKHLQLPVQPLAILEVIEEALITSDLNPEDRNSQKHGHVASTPRSIRILLLLNSIDSISLRRSTTQNLLARLVSHPSKSIAMIATADTINFSLLWDSPLRSKFRFLFHDCTTFAPYTAEIDVVETVNGLLNRSGRRVGGKDGAAFVLKSLPANARSLFRVLVAEQIAAAADGDGFADEDRRDDDFEDADAARAAGDVNEGVEYRLLYRKAVEELICTNENGFRTLLKEFYDHQMLESRRDSLGTERLVVLFRKDELEDLLEELVD